MRTYKSSQSDFTTMGPGEKSFSRMDGRTENPAAPGSHFVGCELTCLGFLALSKHTHALPAMQLLAPNNFQFCSFYTACFPLHRILCSTSLALGSSVGKYNCLGTTHTLFPHCWSEGERSRANQRERQGEHFRIFCFLCLCCSAAPPNVFAFAKKTITRSSVRV